MLVKMGKTIPFSIQNDPQMRGIRDIPIEISTSKSRSMLKSSHYIRSYLGTRFPCESPIARYSQTIRNSFFADKRVDPAAEGNKAVKQAISGKHTNAAMLLLSDPRVSSDKGFLQACESNFVPVVQWLQVN
jgi:hypothetical protein